MAYLKSYYSSNKCNIEVDYLKELKVTLDRIVIGHGATAAKPKERSVTVEEYIECFVRNGGARDAAEIDARMASLLAIPVRVGQEVLRVIT